MPGGIGKWLVKTGLFEEKPEQADQKPSGKPSLAKGGVDASTRPAAIAAQVSYHAPLSPEAMIGQDRKFYEGLDALMEQVSSEGFLAFLKALELLGATLTEPSVLFRTAFNVARGSHPGLTLDELFHEIGDCTDVLAREQSALETALSKRVQDQVGQAQRELGSVQQQIEAAESQIREWKVRMQTLQGTISSATTSADQDRESYARAAGSHEAELEQLRTNVNLYLAPSMSEDSPATSVTTTQAR